MKVRITDVLKFVLFLSIGGVILYLVFKNQNEAYQLECATKGIPAASCSLLDKLIADFSRVNIGWLLVVLCCFMLSNLSRMERWRILLGGLNYEVKWYNAFGAVLIGYFANLGLPRMGEVVRAGVLARNEKIPVETAMGTIVIDRLLDVLSLAIIMAFAFLLEYDTIMNFIAGNQGGQAGATGGGTPWFTYIVIAGILFMAIGWWQRERLLATSVGQRIWKMAKGFLSGLASIKMVKRPLALFFHSINIWFMYFLMAWIGLWAFPPTAHLGPITGLMVFVFGSLGIVIPSPGGMGTFHFFATEALKIYGVSGEDAFSFANITFFSVNLGCNIITGLLALLLLPVLNNARKK